MHTPIALCVCARALTLTISLSLRFAPFHIPFSTHLNEARLYVQHNWQQQKAKKPKFIIHTKTSMPLSPSVFHIWFADICRNNTITFTYDHFFVVVVPFFPLFGCVCVILLLYLMHAMRTLLLVKNLCYLCHKFLWHLLSALALFFINCTIFVVANWSMVVVVVSFISLCVSFWLATYIRISF